MNVKLLKDLPFVKAGSIGIFENGELTFSGETLLYREEDIKRKYEWFQVVKDGPVWEYEDWTLDDNGDILVCNDNGCSALASSPIYDDRKSLILAAPDMWRMLKSISDMHPSLYVAKDAYRLLKKIECTE